MMYVCHSMSAKKRKESLGGLVFSTDPEFKADFDMEDMEETPEPSRQKLIIMLDRKQRAGKEVTLITGFKGKEQDLSALGKSLRNACGAGGSEKDGDILIQGDHRKKIQTWLEQKGYSVKVR